MNTPASSGEHKGVRLSFCVACQQRTYVPYISALARQLKFYVPPVLTGADNEDVPSFHWSFYLGSGPRVPRSSVPSTRKRRHGWSLTFDGPTCVRLSLACVSAKSLLGTPFHCVTVRVDTLASGCPECCASKVTVVSTLPLRSRGRWNVVLTSVPHSE